MKIANIQVELIEHMGSDISVVNAARVSFNKQSYFEYEDENPFIQYVSNKDCKLIKYLADHNHFTPFCHAFLSFRIKAPIFVARQLAKHQVGLSWNEVSRRYVDDEPEFYFPDKWRAKADNVKQGSSTEFVKFKNNREDYHTCPGESYNPPFIENFIETSLNLYLYLIEKKKVCPEQARMILPLNTMTEWIWSGSLLAFIRVCKLRLDKHAQKETRDVAELIGNNVKTHFPVSWESYMK